MNTFHDVQEHNFVLYQWTLRREVFSVEVMTQSKGEETCVVGLCFLSQILPQAQRMDLVVH